MAEHLVDFYNHCSACKYYDKNAEDGFEDPESPCYDCLDDTVNEDSRQPTKFEPSHSLKNLSP